MHEASERKCVGMLTCGNMSSCVCVCVSVCVCVCVCVVREVNVFLLAHSGGSSWCKRRRGLLVLTLVPVFHSEHAGPPITATHHWAPQT